MEHKVKKEDLDEYVKCLAVKRGCPVDSVNRNKAHWDLIMNRKACMEAIKAYKVDKEYSCSLSVARDLRIGTAGIDIEGKSNALINT